MQARLRLVEHQQREIRKRLVSSTRRPSRYFALSAKRQLLVLARSDIADLQASANDNSAFWERTRADISSPNCSLTQSGCR